MSAVEKLGDRHGKELESGARVQTVQEDMLASIARTGFYSGRLPWIPLISIDSLNKGNTRVESTVAADGVRHATIVGHDAIKFEGQEATILPGYRMAELLGLLIFERKLVPPKRYAEMGFFAQAATPRRRQVVLAQTTNKLQEKLKDIYGRPFATREGTVRESRLGVVDIVVRDIRYTTNYREARRMAAFNLFEEYIKNGGQEPSLFEQPAIEGARTALRGLVGSGMTKEQVERFKNVSENGAAALVHRTDLYDQENPMASPVRYARSKVQRDFAPSWQEGIACGPEVQSLFFPPVSYSEKKRNKITREAKAKELCRSCPAQVDCLEDALARNEPYGIWGGLNEKEREVLLKQL